MGENHMNCMNLIMSMLANFHPKICCQNIGIGQQPFCCPASKSLPLTYCPALPNSLSSIPHICYRRHRRCLCNFFLPGVNFSRLNAKRCIFCNFRNIFGVHLVILGCKIWDQTNPASVNKMTNMRYAFITSELSQVLSSTIPGEPCIKRGIVHFRLTHLCHESTRFILILPICSNFSAQTQQCRWAPLLFSLIVVFPKSWQKCNYSL